MWSSFLFYLVCLSIIKFTENKKVHGVKKGAEKLAANVKKEFKKEELPKEEPLIHIGRLDFRVGRILKVQKHLNMDNLYVKKIDLGEEKPRTVVSGLVNMSVEDLQNRSVVVLCNIRPVKMKGVSSKGMLMCACTEQSFELLIPPETSVPGDNVTIPGFVRDPDPELDPQKKIFEFLAFDLNTNKNKVATYKGIEWRVGDKGFVKANTLAKAVINVVFYKPIHYISYKK